MKLIRLKPLTAFAVLLLFVGVADGGSYRGHYITAAGAVIGNGTAMGTRPKCISIAQMQGAGSATESLFQIWSPDLKNYVPGSPLSLASCDSILLGGGGSFDECFESRVDSLHCLSLAAGAEFAVWAK